MNNIVAENTSLVHSYARPCGCRVVVVVTWLRRSVELDTKSGIALAVAINQQLGLRDLRLATPSSPFLFPFFLNPIFFISLLFFAGREPQKRAHSLDNQAKTSRV